MSKFGRAVCWSASGGLVALLSCALFILGPSVVKAQIESSIAISGSPNYPLCEINDISPGVRTLYVIHRYNAGVIASRFKIQSGPGITMSYMSETHYFPFTIGNTQEGISVCYGPCELGEKLIASITYMAYGTTSPCSQILVVSHPSAQTVEAIRCDGIPIGTYVEDLAVSHNSGCGCPSTHGFQGTAQVFTCQPVPVANTTWGAIKSLFSN